MGKEIKPEWILEWFKSQDEYYMEAVYKPAGCYSVILGYDEPDLIIEIDDLADFLNVKLKENKEGK